MTRICIPDHEYQERRHRAAALLRDKGLDALIVNGNEADYANPRYFSGFWPVFERAGVAINQAGEGALMVGPESGLFARDFGRIADIFVMAEYRESADPSYPHMRMATYRDVFDRLRISGENLRIGVASILDTNVVIWESLKATFPKAELVDARDVMVALRSIKSENEIDCLREAARITKIATDEVIKVLRPGVTELQMVGVAQAAVYANGAEYEGLPMYCFSQRSTKHAISRSSYRTIESGDIVQLNLSAKVDGYSPAIGIPVSMGPLLGEKRDIVEFVLEMHRWTEHELRAGAEARDIAIRFEQLFREKGHEAAYTYGPCGGLGLVEVEAPWMETTSDYVVQPNMTFQIDTFGVGTDFGVRWEKPVAVREGGLELLSPQIGEIVEIEC